MKRKYAFVLLGLLIASVAFAGVQEKLIGVIARKNAAAPATAPDYGGEIERWAETSSSATTAIVLDSGIAAGSRAILGKISINATQAISSIADSRSNTWAVDRVNLYDTTKSVEIASAYVTTALQTGDTITITWANPSYTYRFGVVAYVTNATNASPDQSALGNGFGTSPAASADTSTAATQTFGIISLGTTSPTYGSSNWDLSGTYTDYGSMRIYFVEKKLSSAGTQNPAGTISGNQTWGVTWVAYK